MLLLAGLLGLLGLVGLVGILTGVTVCMEIDISSTGMIRMILMVEMRVRRVLVRERVEDVVNWTNCPFVAEKNKLMKKRMIVTLLLLCFAPFAVAFAREVRRPSKGFGKGLGRATSETQKESEEGKLDVFGLPPPTADSIFPKPSGNDISKCSGKNGGFELERVYPELNRLHPRMRQIHDAPPVFVIDNFLSSSDVQELVEAFKDPSVGLSMKSPQFSSAVSTRTSSTKFLPYDYPVVARFLSAAMDLLNAPMCNFEEPQVVRYKIGQEFTEHYDFVPPSSDKDVTQRAATLLVYLSSVSGSSGGG